MLKKVLTGAGVLGAVALLGYLFIPESQKSEPVANAPNIVFMLSDNVGYGELGVYGGGGTPRLDQLAATGAQFTNFNVEAECTPSRAALMTGRLPIRSGTGRAGLPGFPQGLAPWEYTMAEMLSDNGYDTAIFGKWHLGDSEGRFPTDQGFDEWWGFPWSTGIIYRFDYQGFEGNEDKWPYIVEAKRGEIPQNVMRYDRDVRSVMDEKIAEKSIDYINRHKGSEDPFFLYIGWSHMHHPYVPHPDFKGKSGQGDYKDLMMEHDFRVGQVLDALKEAGLDDNTIVVYASDNGPDAGDYPVASDSGPYKGFLGSAYEGSIRTPMIISAPGRIEEGIVKDEMISILDFYPTFANVTGGTFPNNRAYDGVDQTDFIFGDGESARDHVITFLANKLLAVKADKYKVYFTGDSPQPRNREHDDLYAHEIYDVEKDPGENVDIFPQHTWMLPEAYTPVLKLAGSMYKYGSVKIGEDYRTPGIFSIPPVLTREKDVKRVFLQLRHRVNEE